MTDPIRLLDVADDEFEHALLASAAGDRAGEAARARALAVFGSVGLSLVASTSAASAGLSAAAAPGLLATAHVSQLGLSALAKWIGIGVVVGTVSAGGIHAVAGSRQELSPPARAAAKARPATATAAATPRVTREPDARRPVEVSTVLPLAREPSAVKAEPLSPDASSGLLPASNAAFPAAADSASRLREELLALEPVRQALRRGNAASAIAALAEYEARFPRGALSREATLLAVEARLAAGDVQGAHAIAARVLATDSNSPHAKKLQALLSSRRIP
jgi:hypothetical protein